MKIGCFGKLPISPEFIKVNASGSALQAFDQWLQEGIHYARTKHKGWSEDFLKMDTWNFVFTSPDNQELLIGIVSPKQDRAGRTFPFLLFICTDRREWSKPLYLVPAMCADFLQHAREMAERGWENSNVQTFRSQIQNVEFPELKDQQDAYETYLQSHTVPQFFEDIFEQDAGTGRSNIREVMMQHLVSLRDDQGASTDTSIRIPLRSREPLSAFDVVFWIEIVSKLWDEQGNGSMYFWVHHPKADMPYLFVTTQPASPKIFLGLVQSSRHSQDTAIHENTNDDSQPFQQSDNLDHVTDELPEAALTMNTSSKISLTEIRNALSRETTV